MVQQRIQLSIMYSKYANIDGLEILLPIDIYNSIKENVDKFYPAECGGVFVGKIEGETAIIEQMMMPPKFKSNRIWFLRISEYLNEWLSHIFSSTKGNNIYLGEWHSHCNALPLPSNKDLHTMIKISLNDGTRIKTPLMLIVGYDKKEFIECFYILFGKKLIPYEKIN